MDSHHARLILLCYRPGTKDAADPQIAEALRQAERDPELGQWLQQMTAFDAAFRSKLKEHPVPPDLPARIQQREPPPPRATSARRMPQTWVAAAAVFVLILFVAGLFWRVGDKSGFAGYRSQMLRFVARDYQLDFHDRSLADMRQRLATAQWPYQFEVPAPLESVPLEGGCALTWRGQRVSLLCFEDQENEVWLFVADRAIVQDTPPSSLPQFWQSGHLASAAWTRGDKLYLLVVPGDGAALRRYL